MKYAVGVDLGGWIKKSPFFTAEGEIVKSCEIKTRVGGGGNISPILPMKFAPSWLKQVSPVEQILGVGRRSTRPRSGRAYRL